MWRERRVNTNRLMLLINAVHFKLQLELRSLCYRRERGRNIYSFSILFSEISTNPHWAHVLDDSLLPLA